MDESRQHVFADIKKQINSTFNLSHSDQKEILRPKKNSDDAAKALLDYLTRLHKYKKNKLKKYDDTVYAKHITLIIENFSQFKDSYTFLQYLCQTTGYGGIKISQEDSCHYNLPNDFRIFNFLNSNIFEKNNFENYSFSLIKSDSSNNPHFIFIFIAEEPFEKIEQEKEELLRASIEVYNIMSSLYK